MKSLRKIAPLALLALLVAAPLLFKAAPPAHAQDSTVVTDVYLERGNGRIVSQAGGGGAYNIRSRFTIAQVNAGATILTARPGIKYRVIDQSYISVGGAVGTCTTVDILGTQSASGVKLVAAAIAALTQNTLLRAGATNSTILAAGASFVANDVNTAVTIGKTGGTCDTATHVDVNLTYAIETS